MNSSRCLYISGSLRVSTKKDSETLGPRTHILGWIAAAQRRGLDVEQYILGDKQAALPPRISTEGIVRGNRIKTAVVDVVRMASNIRTQRKVSAEHPGPFDFVYERHAAFQSIGRVFSGTVPWILESNGLFFREARADRNSLTFARMEARSELRAYSESDLLICVSEALADHAQYEADRRGLQLDPYVLPNGVDTTLFDPNRYHRDATNPSRVSIGFVGSIVEWQNLVRLFNAADVVSREVPLHVTIVGDGPFKPSLQRLAETLTSGSLDITFMDPVPLDEVPRILSKFDVGFAGHLPLSIGDMYHSPLKAYEYLSMGKRCLLANWPYAGKLSAEVPGIETFQADDTSSLVDALRKLATEPETGETEAILRRDHIVAQHSWDARIMTLLQEARRRGLLS